MLSAVISMLTLLLASTLALAPNYRVHVVPNRIKDFGLKRYVSMNQTLPRTENKPWKLVCEMPYNCQFQRSISSIFT